MVSGVTLFLVVLEGSILAYIIWKFRLILLSTKKSNCLQLLQNYQTKLEEVIKSQQNLELKIKQLQLILNHSFAAKGIVRFSALSDIGVNQSFSLCLLTHKKNGLIITNIFTNQTNRLYLKEITKGQPTTPLSPEEKEAFKKAQQQLEIITLKSRQLSKI